MEDRKSILHHSSKLSKSSLNLAQIHQFWSNRVGDPFGPQELGALTLMCSFSWSLARFCVKVVELSTGNPPNPNPGSSPINGPFLQSSHPEIRFCLELWTESNGWGLKGGGQLQVHWSFYLRRQNHYGHRWVVRVLELYSEKYNSQEAQLGNGSPEAI